MDGWVVMGHGFKNKTTECERKVVAEPDQIADCEGEKSGDSDEGAVGSEVEKWYEGPTRLGLTRKELEITEVPR